MRHNSNSKTALEAQTAVFSYLNSHAITFQLEGGDVMVNLTQMAKAFGKRPADFLENAETKAYIKALGTRYGNSRNAELVRVVRGGRDPQAQGTWAHQKIALRFAQWLSPDFALWVDDRIEDLLVHGRTEIAAQQESDAFDLMLRQINILRKHDTRLTTIEKDVQVIKLQVEQQRKQPKFTADAVFASHLSNKHYQNFERSKLAYDWLTERIRSAKGDEKIYLQEVRMMCRGFIHLMFDIFMQY